MLYQHITKELNSGSLFISDTVNYRRLEDELISKDSWLKDKTKILDNLSDCLILKPIAELLKAMEKEIDGLYKRVNHRIVSKQNKNIKVDEDKLTWRLPYKKKEDLVNNSFYKKLETVLDIVYNHTSALKITAVSGDMHSINRINFALMYLFGYDFMPRFTKINRKADKNLVAFKKPSEYSKFLIKPSKKISKQLIIDEWE